MATGGEDDSRKRVTLTDHAIEFEDLKPGDHIYCHRKVFGKSVFTHHGIYIGERGCEVIHFAAENAKISKGKETAQIRKTTLDDFLYGDELRLVAYDGTVFEKIVKKSETLRCYKSDPAEKVIERAKYYLRNPNEWKPYNLITNNCECFAFFCKTGRKDYNSQGHRLKGFAFPKNALFDIGEAFLGWLNLRPI